MTLPVTRPKAVKNDVILPEIRHFVEAELPGILAKMALYEDANGHHQRLTLKLEQVRPPNIRNTRRRVLMLERCLAGLLDFSGYPGAYVNAEIGSTRVQITWKRDTTRR